MATTKVTTNVIADDAVTTAKILDDNVTYAKMQDTSTANRVLGAASAGTIGEVQVATDMIADDAVTKDKVANDLRAVQYIGVDTGDYIEFTADTQLDIFVNGSNEFRFEADGDFHADGDVIAYSTTTPSDERLKDNVQVITNALHKVKQITGVTFNWANKDDKKSGGIIAQQLEKVMPEIVKDIDDLKTDEKFKAVDYNGIVGLLIEAVKELSQKVENCNCK